MPLVTVMRHSIRLDSDPNFIIARVFDTPLSQEGINLALNTKIPGVKRVISSPFLRCVHTAALVHGKCSLVDNALSFTPGNVVIDNRVREVWNRRVLGAPIDQVTLLNDDELQGEMHLDMDITRTDHAIPGIEETRGMHGDADLRFKAAIQAIVEENPDVDHILIVSHGDAVSAMANMVSKEIYEANFCCHITAEYKDNAWTFVESKGVGIF